MISYPLTNVILHDRNPENSFDENKYIQIDTTKLRIVKSKLGIPALKQRYEPYDTSSKKYIKA